MMFSRTYFLPPTDDFLPPPPRGPLSLGSIIANTSQPQRPLNIGAVVDVASADIASHLETNWHKTISASTGQGIGVYAQFLLMTGFDAELSVNQSKSDTSIMAFESLTTTSFEPSETYVADAVKAAAVQRYTKKNMLGMRKPVYLVTGIKTVSGAKIKYTKGAWTRATAKVGVDFTAAGAPVKIGPQGHRNKTNDAKTDFERASEFLFAFRVLKVSYKHGEATGELYSEGAFLGKDDTKTDEKPEAEEIAVDSIVGVSVVDEVDGSEIVCVSAS